MLISPAPHTDTNYKTAQAAGVSQRETRLKGKTVKLVNWRKGQIRRAGAQVGEIRTDSGETGTGVKSPKQEASGISKGRLSRGARRDTNCETTKPNKMRTNVAKMVKPVGGRSPGSLGRIVWADRPEIRHLLDRLRRPRPRRISRANIGRKIV